MGGDTLTDDQEYHVCKIYNLVGPGSITVVKVPKSEVLAARVEAAIANSPNKPNHIRYTLVEKTRLGNKKALR
jgi:hypothetical protein